MPIDKPVFADMLRRVTRLWHENTDRLTDIDSRFGDGDHGVTIGKIAAATIAALDEWDERGFDIFLADLGDSVMAVGGGSAGPLFGSLIGGFGEPLAGMDTLDSAALQRMFAAGLSSLQELTKAGVGDKTMMDALIPAVAAAQAAAAGMHATEDIPSKFGRARHYGEQTIGTPDAGAVSVALLFQGLHEGYIR